METNQAAFNSSPNGMVAIGENGTVSHLNPTAEKIFACTNKEVHGKEFSEFLQAIDIVDHELLEKCNATTPYSTCKKATSKDGTTCYLDLWLTFQPTAVEENRYLLFVNDITSQKKKEEKLKQAYATETTLKRILHICRTVEKLDDTLTYALQLTVALPGTMAIPRGVIMATENDLSRLELKAHIGLDHDELSTFFQKKTADSFSLDNTGKKIENLCRFISQGKNAYHAIIEGNTQTVVMVVALEEKLKNAFAGENLNSVADVIADTIEREKLKKEQAELIASLNASLSDLGTERSFSDSVLESMNSGLLVIDNKGRVTQANPAAKQFLLNLYEGDVTGKTLEEILGPETNILRRHSDTTGSHKITVLNLDKEEINLEFTTPPTFTIDGTPKGKVIVFSDVTDQQKMGAKLDKLNRFSAVAGIAAAVAHEIKNPLAGIKSMSQILAGRLSAADENKEYVGRILKQVDRLDLLLNDFFSYAKPATPNKQKITLNEVLRQAWQVAEARGDKKGLSLHESLSGEPASLWADPEQLQQVFVNLFLNAIETIDDNSYVEVTSKFINKPSEKYDLSLFKGLNDSFSYQVVTIRDSGSGIAKDMEAKLFDPFVTNKSNHSGLGLSLVWRILKEHESNIYFESTAGEGSTFTIFIKAESGDNR
ncbi:MAG: PAS domain S-box protein [Thermodesulfobacteriota bacterium]